MLIEKNTEYEKEYGGAFSDEQKEEEQVKTEETIENEDIKNENIESEENQDEIEEIVEETTQNNETENIDEENKDAESEERQEDEDKNKITIKWKGKDIDLTQEEIKALAQKGFDYGFKSQTLAKHKKRLEKLDQYNLSDDDLEIVSKIKNGDKESLAYLAKQSNIDVLDAADIENPTFSTTNKEENIVISESVKHLVSQVQENEALFNELVSAESKLPESITKAMAQDANLFVSVVNEVQSGDFEKVYPSVVKRLATLDNLQVEFIKNDANAFANLYTQEKQKLLQSTQVVNKKSEKIKKNVNLAEIKANKSSTSSSTEAREREVLKNAMNDDSEYQRILNKVQNNY